MTLEREKEKGKIPNMMSCDTTILKQEADIIHTST